MSRARAFMILYFISEHLNLKVGYDNCFIQKHFISSFVMITMMLLNVRFYRIESAY